VDKEQLQTPAGETVTTAEDASSEKSFLIKVNREKNEIVFTDPETGKETTLKATVLDDDAEFLPPRKPLTPEEFRQAWDKLNELKITWTTDIPPVPQFRKDWEDTPEFWTAYREVQKQFPNFPRDLGNAILHKLLHKPIDGRVDAKAEIAGSLLTQEYRSEFFFKYAIKVPYFEDIDWEVVIKAYERGAHPMPKIAYALLQLTLREPVNTTLSVEEAANEYREPQFITVAVNEQLIDTLIDKLVTIRQSLEKAQRAAERLTEMEAQEEITNGTAS